MSKYKKWVIGFLILIVLVFGFIIVMNVTVDPFGYFKFQGGDYEKIGETPVNDSNYSRYFKAEHVKNFGDQYDAYIVGGSKAGTYQPETLKQLDGLNYYNMFAVAGNMNEYYQNVKYLIENTKVKKIFLNISGGEVRRLESGHLGDIFEIPAAISGKSEKLEFIDFMLKDVNVSFDAVKTKLERKKNDIKIYPDAKDGSRDLTKYYDALAEDQEAFIKKYVTKRIESQYKRLFEKPVDRAENYQPILQDVKNIKKLCEDNGVELLTVLAPSFIGEMSEHDGSAFWQYLYDLFSITDVWDFSGYHDIGMNPYYFYNDGHFFYEVFELMVDTMNGKSTHEGFGTYVTKENAYEHLEQRKADYYRLKQEYKETGTIKLGGYEDAGRIK